MEKYDLIDRSRKFSLDVRSYCKNLPKDLIFNSDIRQVIRSSASIGANFLEATEKLGPKDLKHRLRISLKEAKETIYWLQLIQGYIPQQYSPESLINEATEIKKIIASIINKLK